MSSPASSLERSVSVLRTMGEELVAIKGKLRSGGMSWQRMFQESTVRLRLIKGGKREREKNTKQARHPNSRHVKWTPSASSRGFVSIDSPSTVPTSAELGVREREEADRRTRCLGQAAGVRSLGRGRSAIGLSAHESHCGRKEQQ